MFFFCMVALLAVILEEQVDEVAPGTERMFHHENRVKIHCRLGGVGEHKHTHTNKHKHTGLRKASRIYPQWTVMAVWD